MAKATAYIPAIVALTAAALPLGQSHREAKWTVAPLAKVKTVSLAIKELDQGGVGSIRADTDYVKNRIRQWMRQEGLTLHPDTFTHGATDADMRVAVGLGEDGFVYVGITVSIPVYWYDKDVLAWAHLYRSSHSEYKKVGQASNDLMIKILNEELKTVSGALKLERER